MKRNDERHYKIVDENKWWRKYENKNEVKNEWSSKLKKMMNERKMKMKMKNENENEHEVIKD